jgi:CheY-like chemotaxis protein
MPTSETRTGARADRGQLIPLPHPTRRRGESPRADQPRRLRRASPVLMPQWSEAAQAASEPRDRQLPTDGALALLEQPVRESLVGPRRIPARGSVLIVEDDTRMARLLRESLALEGEPQWDVQVALDGARALEIAALTPPDVVLLDVLLPGLDGAEVYRRLRANKRTHAARILFLTAGSPYDLQQRGIFDGVLLRKPFDIRELPGLVRALLEG